MLKEGIGKPIVIASDEDTITFILSIYVQVQFQAMFNFYIDDPIDGDEIYLTSEEADKEETVHFDLTITAQRSLEESLLIHEVETEKYMPSIDFDYVEVSPYEDPRYEEY